MRKKLLFLIVLFSIGQMSKAQVTSLLSGDVLKPTSEVKSATITHKLPQSDGVKQYWVSAMAHFDEYGWFDASSLTPVSTQATLVFNGNEVTFDGIVDMGTFQLDQKYSLKGIYDAEAKTITIPTPGYSPDKGMSDYAVLGTMTYYGSEIYLAVFSGQFSEQPDANGQYGLETVDELVFDVSDDLSTLVPRTGYGCYGFTVDGNYNQGFLNFYKTATYNLRPEEGKLLVSPSELLLSGNTITVGATVSSAVKLSNIGLTDTRFWEIIDFNGMEVRFPNNNLPAGATMECELLAYPTAAGTETGSVTFESESGSTTTVNITIVTNEAPDFSPIVKNGDIAFSYTFDMPFVLNSELTGFPVAMASNSMESTGNSSLVANVSVPAGKTGILSWKGMSGSLHPNGGALIYVDGDEFINNIYEHQNENFVELPLDQTIVLKSGHHDIVFTQVINMNSYLFGWCDRPFYTYVYDFDLQLVDESEHSAILLTPSVDMGNHYVDKLSTIDQATVTLLNVGTSPLEVTSVSTDGAFSGVKGTEVAAYGDRRDVTLTFETMETGTFTGKVVISTNAGDFSVDCSASAEKIPTDYSPIVSDGEFSFNTAFDYPFIQESNYAYSSTSYHAVNGKLVSWLEAYFIIPEGQKGTLTWDGVNSSEDWFNFMGSLSFNDGTRIKIDDSIVHEYCGEADAGSSTFSPNELLFTAGRHKIRFEYEKILSVPKGEDLFRLFNLALKLETDMKVDDSSISTTIVRTEILSPTGERLSRMGKGLNILRQVHSDGSVTVVKVLNI